MSHEQEPVEEVIVHRPVSPHYHALRQILLDADVQLLPTDRDLAPTDHHNDEADPA